MLNLRLGTSYAGSMNICLFNKMGGSLSSKKVVGVHIFFEIGHPYMLIQ
jgi:hypothetical protein